MYAAIDRAVSKLTGAIRPKEIRIIGRLSQDVILMGSNTHKLTLQHANGLKTKCDALKLGNSLRCLNNATVTLDSDDGDQIHFCRHHIDMINGGRYMAVALMVGCEKKYQVFKL